jgi:hypothetical protein
MMMAAYVVSYPGLDWKFVGVGSQYDRFCWISRIEGVLGSNARAWVRVNADGQYAGVFQSGAGGLISCLDLDQGL